jgi:hypothetical protein
MPEVSLSNVLTNFIKLCQLFGSIQKETPPTAVNGVSFLQKNNY